MKKILCLMVLLLLFSSPVYLHTHPGGLDSDGGHYNRRTGQYHYHRRREPVRPLPVVSSPAIPVKTVSVNQVKKRMEDAPKTVGVAHVSIPEPDEAPPDQAPESDDEVIGGFAVLVAIVFAVLYFRERKKNRILMMRQNL